MNLLKNEKKYNADELQYIYYNSFVDKNAKENFIKKSYIGVFESKKEIVEYLIPEIIENMGVYSCYFNYDDFIFYLNEKRYRVVKVEKYDKGVFVYYFYKVGNKGKLINRAFVKEKKPKKIKNLNELVLKTYKEYDDKVSNDEILSKFVGVFNNPKDLVSYFISDVLDEMKEYVDFFNFKKFIEYLEGDYTVLYAPSGHLLLFNNF